MILPAVGTYLPDNTLQHIKDSNLSTHLCEYLQFHTFCLTNDKGSDKTRKRGYIWKQNISVKFYISLTVHLGIILVNNQIDALFSMYLLFPFCTCFDQSSAHHQENRTVSIHDLVYITLCRWHQKKCVKLVINKNQTEMHSERNIKFCIVKQAKQIYKYKNIKTKLYKNNAAIWYNKTCRMKHITSDHMITQNTNVMHLILFIR